MAKTKTASARGAAEQKPPLRLEYIPAEQLNDNPANWRLHPKDQLEAIDTLLDEVGWAGALLYNEATKRLLDGHGRKQIALKKGGLVPVLIGSWTTEQENKILATYDAVGDMAETDHDALEKLLGNVGEMKDVLKAAVADKTVNWTRATVPVVSLKDHPQNYKQHPDEQIDHIVKSIADNGFFRAIVVAKDNTVLAGHGVKRAAIRGGHAFVPVIRTPFAFDDPRALKILAADNEIGRVAERDDKALTDLLDQILVNEGDLLGTGYDAFALGALKATTAPIGRRPNKEELAAEWADAGMPAFSAGGARLSIQIHFTTDEKRQEFAKKLAAAFPGLELSRRESMYSAWWPVKENKRKDVSSVRWMGGAESEE